MAVSLGVEALLVHLQVSAAVAMSCWELKAEELLQLSEEHLQQLEGDGNYLNSSTADIYQPLK